MKRKKKIKKSLFKGKKKVKTHKAPLISSHLFYNVMPYISITMYTSMGLIKFLDNINAILHNGLPRWL